MNEFHEMRRRDRAISEEAALSLLNDGEYGILATIGEDGWPYGVPLSYAYEEGNIYFHSAPEGHKLENLRYVSKVAFTVVGETHVLQEAYSTAYESVIVFGTVRPLEGREKTEALVKLAQKYCYDYLDRAESYAEKSSGHVRVYCLEIKHITGKQRQAR